MHSKSSKVFALACAAVLVPAFVCQPALWAQSSAQPKEFFPKDFAAGIGEAKTAESPERRPATKTALPETERESPESSMHDDLPTPQATLDVAALPDQGEPVLAVGAILNSLDKQHYEDCLRELSEAATRFDLPLGEIYTIGDMRNLYQDTPALFKVLARGAKVSVKDKPRSKYKVTKSPTWIIKTPKGEVVLEATGPLANNFNQKGEFVDRNARLESASVQAVVPSENLPPPAAESGSPGNP